MNKKIERYIRTGILCLWPLASGGMALAQSVPGSGQSTPDVGSTGDVGTAPSGNTGSSGEMRAAPSVDEFHRSHRPSDTRIPPGAPTQGTPEATPPDTRRPQSEPPVNPGDQPAMPGAPSDTQRPAPAPTEPRATPPTPGAPRPGTANQTQGAPLPADVIPPDSAAGQMRDVTPQHGRGNTSMRPGADRTTDMPKR